MQKTVYEILESFIPYERFKKTQSFLHLNCVANQKIKIQSSKSSIILTSPAPKELPVNDDETLNSYKSEKNILIKEMAKLQFSFVEYLGKDKEVISLSKKMKTEDQKLTEQKNKLISNKLTKENCLKEINSKLLLKLPEHNSKKKHCSEVEKQMIEEQAIYNKTLAEISSKINAFKKKFDEKHSSNNEMLIEYNKKLNENENLLKIHNLTDLNSQINKAKFEITLLVNQIKDIENSIEMSTIDNIKKENNLENNNVSKKQEIEALKKLHQLKIKEYGEEIDLLKESTTQKKSLKENFENSIKQQKSIFLKHLKDNDNQKLNLSKEQSYKKEFYDTKFKNMLEIAREKTTQINYKHISTKDIEVEELKQSNRMLKTKFELDLSNVLAKRETLKSENNNKNVEYQKELSKKNSLIMKLNRINQNQKMKEEKYQKDLEQLEKLKNMNENIKNTLNDLEGKKTLISNELDILMNTNKESQKIVDSIGTYNLEIEDKKREKQWFINIKKEMNSKKETSTKKIKEMKKFTEKTQKELNSQKSLLNKFGEKIILLGKQFDILETKKLEIL